MKIFAGSANKPLAENIAKRLNLPLSPLEIHIFPDGEKRVRVEESVVGQDTVVVQPTAPPVDANYMELFFIVDALKRSGAKSVTMIVPYLGYQRQDHVFREGEAVSLDVVIKTLTAAGADKLIVFDLHSVKTQYISQMPLVHLSALPMFVSVISSRLSVVGSQSIGHQSSGQTEKQKTGKQQSENRKQKTDNRNAILVSPDMGGIRRVKLVSEMLGNMPYVAIEKERNLATGHVSAEKIHGEITGKQAFIVDDMISSGKTIVTAANLLRKNGVEKTYVFATHPVFSGDAPRLLQEAAVEKVFVTDSIYIPGDKKFNKLEVVSIADLITQALND